MLFHRRHDPFERPLWFMRHGATQPNLDGLRCGGDLDVPLTAIGREQVLRSAQQIAAQDLGLQRIVCSALLRTTESASIVARVLGGIPVDVEDGFRERMLGRWNLQSVAATEDDMRHGVTPPDGEPVGEFDRRVLAALQRMQARCVDERILILGSKGIARVLRETLEESSATRSQHFARNAELLVFDLAAPRTTTNPTATDRPVAVLTS